MAYLGLDVGTSACKGLVLGGDGAILGVARRSYPLRLPAPGLVELDPGLVWRASAAVIRRLATVAGDAGQPIRALAVSASGDEGVWIDARGRSVGPAIMSLDTRSAADAEAFAAQVGHARLYRITGLPAHAMYPLVRLLWLRRSEPDTFERVRRMLAWPEFVALRLGVEPAAEPSLAARSLAFDIRAGAYDERLVRTAGLPPDVFPPVVPSGTIEGEVAGPVAARLGLQEKVYVVTGGFDQAMATLGAGVTDPGVVHVGTGSWEAVTALSARPVLSDAMRSSGFSWGRAVAGSVPYTVMASSAGASLLAWLREVVSDGAGRPTVADLLNEAADRPTGLLVLSHFEGSYSPWLDPASRGAIAGLDLATDRGTLVRALLEGVTFELRENVERLRAAGVAVTELRATGGGARSHAWLQLKADVTGLPVSRPAVPDTGSFAAACLAGSAAGAFGPPTEAIREFGGIATRLEPRLPVVAAYEHRFEAHRRLYPALRAWRERAAGDGAPAEV